MPSPGRPAPAGSKASPCWKATEELDELMRGTQSGAGVVRRDNYILGGMSNAEDKWGSDGQQSGAY